MTRGWTKIPVWTWMCDRCGNAEGLAWQQNGLPPAEVMRARGWFIADVFGDLCPVCNGTAAKGAS